jgi:DNA primase
VYSTNGSYASSIFDLLRLEVPLDRVVETNGSRKAYCVGHDDTDPPDMHVYPDHAHCFSCGFHGDIVDVWAAQRNIGTPFEAALDLAREFGIRLTEISAEGQQQAEARRAREVDNLEVAREHHAALKKSKKVREWWEGRGFGADLQERFLLGAASAGTASVRTACPNSLMASFLALIIAEPTRTRRLTRLG